MLILVQKVFNVAEQSSIIKLYGVSCTVTQNILSENVLFFGEVLTKYLAYNL